MGNTLPPTSAAANATRTLDDKHRDELRAFGLTDETIAATGIHSVADGDVADILGWRPREYQFGRAMVFPYPGCDGYQRIKLDFPRNNAKGKPVKYESPRGGGNHAYMPPGFDSSASTIVVTEGEKKALAVSQTGTPCIGLSGVWSWQERRMRNDFGKSFGARRLIDDLAKIDGSGKTVLIVFDSDAIGNTAIQLAECRLSETLSNPGAILKGGATVKVVRIPADGNDKIGADDFIVKHGASAFQALLTEAKPAELPPTPSSMDYARMFVEEHFTTSAGVELRWWRDEFYRYARDRYVKVHAGELHAGVLDWLDRLRPDTKPRHASDVVIALGAVCRVPFTYDMPMQIGEGDALPSDWLRYPNWLSFYNGIIDLDVVLTGKPVTIMRHTPNWFSTLALPYAYDARAKSDLWFQTLNEIFGGDAELVDLLGEWFGYVLTNDTRQHAILLLEGLPRSGKGTILRTMERVIGSENVASPRLMGLGDTFSLWPLVGKRLAICSDAHLGHGNKAMGVMETIKAISGEDTMQVERKFLPPVQARLRVRFALAVNELPRFGDNSGALASRMKIIPFRQSFAGREDRHLDEKLAAESSGILNWAIEGLQRLHQNGRFSDPEASKVILQDFARLVSPIKTFIEDRCVVGPHEVELDSLWKAWCDWCEETKHLPGGREAMGSKLTCLVPGLKRVRRRSNGVRKWSYEGIKLSL